MSSSPLRAGNESGIDGVLTGESSASTDSVSTILTKANKKLEPLNFVFVEKSENPDISFRRVGVNAGTIDTNIDEKSIQSHYFIKFTNGKSVTHNVNTLSTITYDFNNTVGPKSISKQELIFKFNPNMLL